MNEAILHKKLKYPNKLCFCDGGMTNITPPQCAGLWDIQFLCYSLGPNLFAQVRKRSGIVA